ncbi:unnamed protein product, partial [Didymodactylos carnosus]
MAAPTYFPPHEMCKWKTLENNEFQENGSHETFIDGGVYANDPELSALWAIRMQWKKRVNYHLLCIGTGYSSSSISSTNKGGYTGWLFNGLVIDTLMEATRSLIEIVTNNLAKFSDIKRMKFNFEITKSMT